MERGTRDKGTGEGSLELGKRGSICRILGLFYSMLVSQAAKISTKSVIVAFLLLCLKRKSKLGLESRLPKR